MMLKVVVLLAALVGFVSATPFSRRLSTPGDDLQSLCNGKTIDLKSTVDLWELVEEIYRHEENEEDPRGIHENKLECSEHIVLALKQLKTLIYWNNFEPCSPKSIDSYKEYYMEFLDTSTEEKEKNTLPSSLRIFALAYGMELSRFCHARMANILLQIKPILLAEHDFKQVELFVGEGKVIDKLFCLSATQPNDFILPSDFYGPEMRDRKVALNKKTVPELKKLQTICRRRFKPMYDQLLMPVVQLAHLGFSSEHGELKNMYKKMYGDSKGLKDASKTVKMWSRIMFLCEGLENVVLKQSDEERARSGKDGELQIVEVSKQPGATEPAADKPESSARDNVVNGAPSSNEAEIHKGLESIKDAHHESDGLKRDHDDTSANVNPIDDTFFHKARDYSHIKFPSGLVRPMDLKQRASLRRFNKSINEQAKEKVTLKYKALQKVAGYLTKLHMGPYFSALSKKFKKSTENLNEINGEGVRAWGPHMTNEEGVAKELLGALETAVENELAADGPVGNDEGLCKKCISSSPRRRNIIRLFGCCRGNGDANGDPGPQRHDASDHNSQASTSNYDGRTREASGGNKVAPSDSAAAQMRSRPVIASDVVTSLLVVTFILGFAGVIVAG